MNATAKIAAYELSDVFRSKWAIAYFLFFFLMTEALFRMGGGSAKTLLSLLNVVLLVIPLVCLVFGSLYLYNARNFIALLLSQPINRTHLFTGLYTGLAFPLATGFALGISLPFLWHGFQAAGHAQTLGMVVLAGVLLTGIFIALAFLVALHFQDKIKGFSVALALWLGSAVIYDGFVLYIAHSFAAYPLETPMLVLTLFNPIDLARVAILMHFDIAALLGYTGAVFEAFLGSTLGVLTTLGTLLLWVAIPVLIGRRIFLRRDF